MEKDLKHINMHYPASYMTADRPHDHSERKIRGKPKNRLIAEFAESLMQSDSLEDNFSAYAKCVDALGFDGVLYTFIPRILLGEKSDIPPVFLITDTYNPEFFTEYTEERFDKNDFTIRKISQGEKRIIDWWDEEKKKSITRQERHVIEVAREDYMINNGITIPVMSDQRGIAGASVITAEMGEKYNILKKESLATLHLITNLFHASTLASPHRHSHFVQPVLENLNDTEKLVLKYFLSGKPMKNIEYAAGVSYKYANNVLKSVRRKFGNISRDQLSYQLGLIEFLEHL